MIVIGTARTVGVKVLYQLGFDHPLLVALLYLLGQSLALVVYFCSHKESTEEEYEAVASMDKEEVTIIGIEDDDDELSDGGIEMSSAHANASKRIRASSNEDKAFPSPFDSHPPECATRYNPPPRRILQRQGSQTGLSQESHDAVVWVHAIPWQIKPVIPGLFNLANAVLKWFSFQYCAASIAEMLMAGLELVLSVCVARMVRKRFISKWRWAGVGIVAVGLWLVHAAADGTFHGNEAMDNEAGNATLPVADVDTPRQAPSDQTIGALFIFGQCVTAVGQDMAEELLLQEANFPATLLLGMEGLFGLIVGIPLFVLYTYSSDDNDDNSPMASLTTLEQSTWTQVYITFLTAIFTLTGIFNIQTTAVTSSMTRNMWKNVRTLVVWIVGLLIFYLGGNDNLGEEWLTPDSYFILMGFLVMLSGIYVYYKHKE
jgi:hypothetical protein